MITQTSKIMALVATMGLVAGLTGCRSDRCCQDPSKSRPDQYGVKFHTDYPLDDQLVELQQPATFQISGKFLPGNRHQWCFNGSPIDAESAPALGVTGYDTPNLKIASVSLTNCGFYSYENEPVDARDERKRKVSQTAELQIVSHSAADPEILQARILAARVLQTVVVYGTPKAGADGGSTGCPGPYCGYVLYSGSWNFPNAGQAYVANNTGNAVVYHYGVPATNWGCNAAIPKSQYPYRFKVFFKNSVPSGPYALTLMMN